MNYYLWTAGREHGPYTLEQVKEAVIEGTITLQQTARREDTHDWVSLGSIVELPSTPIADGVADPDSAPAIALPKWDVKDYLGYLRENSCYGVLRGIIEVFAALVIVAAVFAMIGGILFLTKPEREIAAGLYQLGAGIGALILIIGLRQASLLMIDMADTLLYNHSKDRS